MHDHRIRYFTRCWHQVIRQGSRLETAVGRISEFLKKGCAQTLRERPADLTVSQCRIENSPGVVCCDVTVNTHPPCIGIYLEATDVEYEAISRRSVDAVIGIGCGQGFRGPESCFAQPRFNPVRQESRRPVRAGSQPRKWLALFRS